MRAKLAPEAPEKAMNRLKPAGQGPAEAHCLRLGAGPSGRAGAALLVAGRGGPPRGSVHQPRLPVGHAAWSLDAGAHGWRFGFFGLPDWPGLRNALGARPVGAADVGLWGRKNELWQGGQRLGHRAIADTRACALTLGLTGTTPMLSGAAATGSSTF